MAVKTTWGIKMQASSFFHTQLLCTDDIEQHRWFHHSATTSKKQTNLAEKTCTQHSSFQMVISEMGKTGAGGESLLQAAECAILLAAAHRIRMCI